MSAAGWDRPWRIGVDGEALRRPMSGVGRYVFHIGCELDALLPLARFFVYARGPIDGLALPSARWEARLEASPGWRRLPSVAWLKWRSPTLLHRDGLDAYWAGRSLMPRLPPGVRTVSTVHDLNAWEVPQTMPFKHRWAHRLWFSGDVRRADVVVCNSQGTAHRLRQRLGVAAQAVAYPGVDRSFAAPELLQPLLAERPSALAALGLDGPYLLAVATLEPRKNLSALLEAFAQLKAQGRLAPHQKLALVGSPGWGTRALRAALDQAASQGVIRLGYVDDALLPHLYRHADALVFPSLYEGFGMPVIEALACGTPVVVSDVPELREAAAGQGVVVAPTVAGIAQGIVQALSMPRPSALGVAQTWSWRRAAAVMAAQLVGTADP